MANGTPTYIDHYQILKTLGSGGFGTVYLARDDKLRREVVLKVLHANLASDQQMRSRFMREARAMARLKHPNIVTVYAVEDGSQQPYIVMEYVAGSSLDRYLQQRGAGRRLSVQEALPILRQMAAALDAAHQQKMVHRDVKPANVLMEPNGHVKLTDFGIVKLLQTASTSLMTSGIMGTGLYMSPEQADVTNQQQIGPASDIYALGIVAYQMLAGRTPFSGANIHAILYAHINTPPPNPRTFNPNIPAKVVPVLQKALAKRPATRYQSASAFVNALEKAVQPVPTTNSAPTATIPSDNKSYPFSGPILVGGVVLLLVGIIVGGILNGFTSTDKDLISLTKTPIPPTSTQTQLSPTSTQIIVPPASTRTSMPPTSTPTTVPPTSTRTSVPPTATQTPMPATSTKTLEPTNTATEGPLPTVTLSPTPTRTPLPTVQLPPDVQVVDTRLVQEDGMIQIYVPEGHFLMGSVPGDEQASDDELPQRSVYLDAFWIDQVEVTNGMYAACVAADECSPPSLNTSFTRYSYFDDPEYSNYPVINVSWDDANTYCQWAGRRLPTEAEWEKAARGTDGRTYPWGNNEAPTEELLNFHGNVGDTTKVGNYPNGASPYGALDMAGNVWEWTADWYDAEYYQSAPTKNPTGPDVGTDRVQRGSSWGEFEVRNVRAGFRNGKDPADTSNFWGFRCAASP